jgi:hypothetical protein
MGRWFLSAAARPLRPGCKVDTALVLVGPQGARKSSVFSALAGEWFSDTHVDLASKDAFLQLAGTWIMEWGEIERVTSRKGADEIKAFLSSKTDKYRPPYGRSVVEIPRSMIQVPASWRKASFEARSTCVSENHSPASAEKTELLRATWGPTSTSAVTSTNQPGAEATAQGQQILAQINDKANTFGKNAFPHFALIQIGYFF